MIERRFILRSENIRAGLVAFIGRLKLEPLLEIVVRDYVERRSNDQNARLWALHALAAEFTGNSAEDMHEEALCRFFGYEEKTMPTGWIKRVPLKRSSQRNKREFRDFMESTEAWYIEEFGVYLDQREAA